MTSRFAIRLRGDGAARPRRYSAISGRRRFRGESGYILVMTGMLIIPLIAFTAFAVDVGSFYAVGTKMQRAADEAALAGVIWNGSSNQSSIVNSVTAKNGFTNGSGGVTVTAVIPPTNPTQLTVTISSPATQYFSGAFLKGETITRSATAQFNQPLPMGSPYGQLGNDPDQTSSAAEQAAWGSSGTPGHWLDVTGWNTPKSEGNEYTSGTCSLAVNPEWGCSASGTGTVANPNNTEFSNQGYLYQIHYDGSTPGPLNIAIYDPAQTQQDNTCTDTTDTGAHPASGLPAVGSADLTAIVAAFSAPTSPYPDTAATATSRYGAANNSYCSGDTAETASTTTAADMVTSYVVRAPVAGKVTSDVTNPAVCGISFSPHSGNLRNLLLNTDGTINTTAQGDEQMPFGAEYHRYVTICTIASPQVGDYILQVRSNAPVPTMTPVLTATVSPTTQALIDTDLGVYNPTAVPADGHNRYSIEGYFGTNPNNRALQTSVAVAAGGKLPMYVNLGTSTPVSTTTVFYLARVGSQYVGSTLQLNLWDIGDGGGGAVASITIVPPTDNTGTTVSQCNWFRDSGGTEVPLSTAGTSVTTSGTGNCTLNNLTSTDFNDRLIQLKIPIPSDYQCSDALNLGCWWKMNYSFPSGNPDDTTTWQAKVLGNPVHLTQ